MFSQPKRSLLWRSRNSHIHPYTDMSFIYTRIFFVQFIYLLKYMPLLTFGGLILSILWIFFNLKND